MDCHQARHLFDAYLSGELSTTLSTELGVHRVHCPECRRALALLEVTGHIIKADHEPTTLDDDFTNRLLHCMSEEPSRLVRISRYIAYIGIPLAAAAVVGLALIGLFDRSKGRVAGRTEVRNPSTFIVTPAENDRSPAPKDREANKGNASDEFEEWLAGARENIDSQRKRGQVLKQQIDLTITQVLDILEEGQQRAAPLERLDKPDDSLRREHEAVPPEPNPPSPQD